MDAAMKDFTGEPIDVSIELHATAFVTPDGMVTVIDPRTGNWLSTQIGADARGTARMLLWELFE
jgi:hypothetical protein